MKARLIGCPVIPSQEFVDLTDYRPKNINHFCIEVEFGIGVLGEEGVDNYSSTVCSPSFLETVIRASEKPIFLRGYMLQESFNSNQICSRINELVSSVEGNSWAEVDKELRKWFISEFD